MLVLVVSAGELKTCAMVSGWSVSDNVGCGRGTDSVCWCDRDQIV